MKTYDFDTFSFCGVFRCSLFAPKCPPRRGKGAQDTPREPQDHPKMPQESPKTLEVSPKTSQVSPKTPQGSLKTRQESPKALQDPPRDSRNHPSARDGSCPGRTDTSVQTAREGPGRTDTSVQTARDGPGRTDTSVQTLPFWQVAAGCPRSGVNTPRLLGSLSSAA